MGDGIEGKGRKGKKKQMKEYGKEMDETIKRKQRSYWFFTSPPYQHY
jgi:hypothetical protein